MNEPAPAASTAQWKWILFPIIIWLLLMTEQEIKQALAAEPIRLGASRTRQVHSERLLGEDRELLIFHEGEPYRLRITRNNRLILTK